MRHSIRLSLVLVFLLALPAFAQEKGQWRASSKSAKAITGDIGFAGVRFGINFLSYTIAQIRTIQPAEAKVTFDLDEEPAGAGNLYRLNIPAQTKFMHKNTLCGAEDTQWIVTFVIGRELRLAFFSGDKIPELTPEAITSGTNLCGTYSFVK